MKRLIVLAGVLVLGAGCTTSNDPSGDGATTAPASAAPETPYELQITAPTGFEAVAGAERAHHVSPDYLDQVFQLTGGGESDQIIVSSYYLPEDAADADRAAQIALVQPHDAELGNTSRADNYRDALVHREQGLHRYYYAENAGGFVEGHYYYLFSGRHLIELSCQWGDGGGGQAVQTACMTLAESLPIPETWNA
ncbi:hypothetical protein [Glycomyces niveus]|uniref:DUF1795 domain-containing protein n=1 Tax=Glycomyces niveus TaxID=2820287 RepID=A0ABS3U918_9ACTN|nr:hypothetical protein [Glycomyces sp. NEAU-S30]MBO3735267.1 hypothetical protein [Glycomyces sp. NEAU-S30]